MKIPGQVDPRPAIGIDVVKAGAPLSLVVANDSDPQRVGGSLDLGIVATLEDGRSVLIGELWAMGPTDDGERISLDVRAHAKMLFGKEGGAT